MPWWTLTSTAGEFIDENGAVVPVFDCESGSKTRTGQILNQPGQQRRRGTS